VALQSVRGFGSLDVLRLRAVSDIASAGLGWWVALGPDLNNGGGSWINPSHIVMKNFLTHVFIDLERTVEF
jgi:hypothetical protein